MSKEQHADVLQKIEAKNRIMITVSSNARTRVREFGRVGWRTLSLCSRRTCRTGSWTAVLTDGRVSENASDHAQDGSCLISRPD